MRSMAKERKVGRSRQIEKQIMLMIEYHIQVFSIWYGCLIQWLQLSESSLDDGKAG
jgi:hypothetical protein